MSDWNIAAKPREERDKIYVDQDASGLAYKERLKTASQNEKKQHRSIYERWEKRARQPRSCRLQNLCAP
ncbi:DNA polymerase III subunit theta [Kluyvera ascorbata]|uniref:DNA polymerase III subunit theta n=1 Tax=Kluyvera ascorbata TaxID=51288 RepID=UPI002947E1D0|nr:DNA polymerase III subunit theta [Kluyvera ascorbata]